MIDNFQDVLDSLVWVTLKESDDFLKVRETLTRIGIASKKENKLYQSCHILHKRGNYAIVHFKELFKLDGKVTDITEEASGRRNVIANLLDEWGLVDLVDFEKSESPLANLNHIKILSYSEKNDWELVTKYNIGKKR